MNLALLSPFFTDEELEVQRRSKSLAQSQTGSDRISAEPGFRPGPFACLVVRSTLKILTKCHTQV